MIIFELNKEDIEYVNRISNLSNISIVIDEPRSFSSDLNTVIQIGVNLAPYAIPAVSLIIIELIKKNKRIRIKVTDEGVEVEGNETKSLEIAKELIKAQNEKKAQEVLNGLLSGR